MAQLDITFYFPQLLFTSLIFLFFYFFIIYNLLPSISYILKLRNKLLIKNTLKCNNIKIIKNLYFIFEILLYRKKLYNLEQILSSFRSKIFKITRKLIYKFKYKDLHLYTKFIENNSQTIIYHKNIK